MKPKKPELKPKNPCFSSGPTSKHPGWNIKNLNLDSLGRSHRAKRPKSRLKLVIDESKELLGIPNDYLVGIVPASDTGAFEMAMWCMLGLKGIDVLSWESFGDGWAKDIRDELNLSDVKYLTADYGELPKLSMADTEKRDVIFTWNGTTSGACLANGNWISQDREGLTMCDATSALFAMEMPWQKLDVVTWSWQKVLGGEAAHGMIALSPRAVERLETYTPSWPIPKVFRLTKKGEIIKDLFEGATINTPSMLAVEDQLSALDWAKKAGGLQTLIERSKSNLASVTSWVEKTPWTDFLTQKASNRSSTSICLSVVDDWFKGKTEDAQKQVIKNIVSVLESEGVGFDIGSYRDAPPGFRIWGGGTVEQSDIEALLPWLEWGYAKEKYENK